MNILFWSEMRRHLIFALTGFCLFISVLLFVHNTNGVQGLFQIDQGTQILWLLLVSIPCMLFGFTQIRHYQKAGLWAYLTHRPTPYWKMFSILSSAALILLFGIFVLPYLLIVSTLDIFSHQLVEERHYLPFFYWLGIVICFYFIGISVVLLKRKIIALSLLFPFVYAYQFHLGIWQIALEYIVVFILGTIALSSFKANVSQPPQHFPFLFCSRFALQTSLFIALSTALPLLFQLGLFVGNAHPNLSPISGSYFDITRKMTDAQRMSHGKKLGDKSAGELLEQQFALSDIYTIWLERDDFTWEAEEHNRAQQLPLADHGLVLHDPDNQRAWRYSYRESSFVKIPHYTGESASHLPLYERPSRNSELRAIEFSSPPRINEFNGSIIDRQNAYLYQKENQTLIRRFGVAGKEFLLTGIHFHQTFASVVSSETVYLFLGRDIIDNDTLLTPFAKINLPSGWENLALISLSEVVDGYIIEFIYGRHAMTGASPVSQHLYKATLSGKIESISSIEIPFDFPSWFTHSKIWISPLYSTLHNWLTSSHTPHSNSKTHTPLFNLPDSVKVLAIGTSTLSMIITFLIGLRRQYNISSTTLWTLFNAFASLPGLLCFLLFDEKR